MDCDCRTGHDGIGHDRLGHLITNQLAQAGFHPVSDADLAALTAAELLALPNLGPEAVRRVHAAVTGHDDDDADADADADTAQAVPAHRRRSRPQELPCPCDPRWLDFGHDERGHRLAMLLARAGLFAGDETVIAGRSDAELMALRQVGPAALERIRERIPHRPPLRLTTEDSGGS